MAESSKEWNAYQMRRDDWEQAIILLERARVKEQEARWKMNNAAMKLEEKTKA